MTPPKRNLLTIAVEDYFQATALKPLVSEKQWEYLESRVEANTQRTLDFLDKYGHTATFFMLGWVAERIPHLAKEITARGHEVASKGYLPLHLHEMSRKDFREDVTRARSVIEAATGLEVLGHRIAKGHLNPEDVWALDILAELGFSYDSSVYPRLRSIAREPWRRFPHFHQHGDREIMELPLSTWGKGGLLLPVAGGNYMRQLPPHLMHRAVAHWMNYYESPFNMYFHVWELDPNLPRISSAGFFRRLRQYRNIRQMPSILGYYLDKYQFESIASFLDLKPKVIAGGVPSVRTAQQSRVPAVATTKKDFSKVKVPVTIIIPCYNEEKVLPYLDRVLNDLKKSLGQEYQLQFLFIDDGSTDRTHNTLINFFGHKGDCDIVRHDRNRGIAASILTGIRHARTEIICSIDCDGSYDPHQLASMIPMLGEDVGMVTASPYHPLGETVGVPSWRLALSRGLSRMYHRILTHKFSTYTSCFRVYRKSMVEDIEVHYPGFLGVLETLTILDAKGITIVECPAVLEARILGYSKMKTVRTILGHLKLMMRVQLNRRKLKHLPKGGTA